MCEYLFITRTRWNVGSPEDEQPKQAGRTSAGTSEHSVILPSGAEEKKWPPILSSPKWRRQVTQRVHCRHPVFSRPKRSTVEESNFTLKISEVCEFS